MTPEAQITQYTQTEYQKYYGEIVGRNGPAIGLAADISYTVRLFTSSGSVDYPNVRPSHRRPMSSTSTVHIEAAHFGDVVEVLFRSGQSPKFIIHEALVDVGCT